jgi:hypothetical protein
MVIFLILSHFIDLNVQLCHFQCTFCSKEMEFYGKFSAIVMYI